MALGDHCIARVLPGCFYFLTREAHRHRRIPFSRDLFLASSASALARSFCFLTREAPSPSPDPLAGDLFLAVSASALARSFWFLTRGSPISIAVRTCSSLATCQAGALERLSQSDCRGNSRRRTEQIKEFNLNRTLSNWTSTCMASSGLRLPLETISSSVSVRHIPMLDRRYSSNVAIPLP
ncbi:hypothetical protein Taro_017663 [Colocasia esculenta]|uniref:Uncharacterized protein n=1 Tax=Colocasia esculenta TaxID=4460 RepID=A0A843URX4_COLES|nr:hypothetical protein [Colocasia esculenta]